jgi:hypothetical protein
MVIYLISLTYGATVSVVFLSVNLPHCHSPLPITYFNFLLHFDTPWPRCPLVSNRLFGNGDEQSV